MGLFEKVHSWPKTLKLGVLAGSVALAAACSKSPSGPEEPANSAPSVDAEMPSSYALDDAPQHTFSTNDPHGYSNTAKVTYKENDTVIWEKTGIQGTKWDTAWTPAPEETGTAELEWRLQDNYTEGPKKTASGIKQADITAPANQAPAISVEAPEKSIAQRNATFSWEASDDGSIDELTIDFGDGTTKTLTENTGSTNHTYAQGGSYTWSMQATDDQGKTSSQEGTITTASLHPIEIESRLYLSQEPNPDASIQLTNNTFAFDTTLTAGADATINAEIPEGEYTLHMDGGASKVSRMRMTDDHVRNNDLFLPTKDWNHTYLVTGYENTPTNFTLEHALYTHMETVDDETTLEHLSRQATKHLAVPNVRETKYIVQNEGNSTCPEDWAADFEPCGDDGENPPGIPATDDQKKWFSQYTDTLRTLFDDPRIGGNPYDIEVVSDKSSELKEHLDKWTSGDIRPKDGVLMIGYHDAAGLTGIGTSDNPEIIQTNRIWIPASARGWYSNEDRFWYSQKESKPPIESVRDDGCCIDPNFDLFPEEFFHYPADRTNHVIAAGFGPWSQLGGYNIKLVNE